MATNEGVMMTKDLRERLAASRERILDRLVSGRLDGTGAECNCPLADSGPDLIDCRQQPNCALT